MRFASVARVKVRQNYDEDAEYKSCVSTESTDGTLNFPNRNFLTMLTLKLFKYVSKKALHR